MVQSIARTLVFEASMCGKFALFLYYKFSEDINLPVSFVLSLHYDGDLLFPSILVVQNHFTISICSLYYDRGHQEIKLRTSKIMHNINISPNTPSHH